MRPAFPHNQYRRKRGVLREPGFLISLLICSTVGVEGPFCTSELQPSVLSTVLSALDVIDNSTHNTVVRKIKVITINSNKGAIMYSIID